MQGASARSHIRRRRPRGPWERALEEHQYPVLRWLTILDRENGSTQVTPRALTRYLGWSENRAISPASAQREVNHALRRLRDLKIISSDKSLTLHEQRVRNLKQLRNPHLVWKDQPTLTIAPEFRANRDPRLLDEDL